VLLACVFLVWVGCLFSWCQIWLWGGFWVGPCILGMVVAFRGGLLAFLAVSEGVLCFGGLGEARAVRSVLLGGRRTLAFFRGGPVRWVCRRGHHLDWRSSLLRRGVLCRGWTVALAVGCSVLFRWGGVVDSCAWWSFFSWCCRTGLRVPFWRGWDGYDRGTAVAAGRGAGAPGVGGPEGSTWFSTGFGADPGVAELALCVATGSWVALIGGSADIGVGCGPGWSRVRAVVARCRLAFRGGVGLRVAGHGAGWSGFRGCWMGVVWPCLGRLSLWRRCRGTAGPGIVCGVAGVGLQTVSFRFCLGVFWRRVVPSSAACSCRCLFFPLVVVVGDLRNEWVAGLVVGGTRAGGRSKGALLVV